MRRFAAAPFLLLILLLTLAARAVAVTPPTIVLTKVEPAVQAIRGGSATTIEIRDPAEELILLDAKGQPFLKMNAAGVQERKGSGSWEEVRKENFFYLHDGHIAQAVTERKSLPYPWQIKGTYGGKPFTMEGTLIPAGAKAGDTGSGSLRMGFLVAFLAFGLVVIGIVGVVILVRSLLRR